MFLTTVSISKCLKIMLFLMNALIKKVGLSLILMGLNETVCDTVHSGYI